MMTLIEFKDMLFAIESGTIIFLSASGTVFVCIRVLREECSKAFRKTASSEARNVMGNPTGKLIAIGDKTYELKEKADDNETIVD